MVFNLPIDISRSFRRPFSPEKELKKSSKNFEEKLGRPTRRATLAKIR